jgi:hypothetical protein
MNMLSVRVSESPREAKAPLPPINFPVGLDSPFFAVINDEGGILMRRVSAGDDEW